MISIKKRKLSSELIFEENNDGDEEVRNDILEYTRLRVCCLGESLSEILVDFFFAMSRFDEDLMQTFQHLRYEIEPRILSSTDGDRDRVLVVMDRIFALIRTGENDILERTKHKKLKKKVEDLEDHVCEIIESFCDQIILLEEILNSVLTKPVDKKLHVKLEEQFAAMKNEQEALKGRIRSILVAEMCLKVEELWQEFEFDE